MLLNLEYRHIVHLERVIEGQLILSQSQVLAARMGKKKAEIVRMLLDEALQKLNE